jgi:hypothetical protein
MAETPSRDPFGSSTESESEAESQDRDRAERRKKREEKKQAEFVDETILDDQEDEENDDPMEDDTDLKECEERLRRIQTAAAEDAAPAPEPEIVRNKRNLNVPFVVKSKLSADLIGADSRIPQTLKKRMPLNLNDSGKVKVKVTADQYGANPVADPSGADDVKFDTTYQSVRSLRKNLNSCVWAPNPDGRPALTGL